MKLTYSMTLTKKWTTAVSSKTFYKWSYNLIRIRDLTYSNLVILKYRSFSKDTKRPLIVIFFPLIFHLFIDKKTLVFDMDETLIKASLWENSIQNYEKELIITRNGILAGNIKVFVKSRPFMKQVLR